MTRTITPRAALGLALISPAVPAAAHATNTAAGPHVPVAAGVLQHTVTVITFPTAKNTFHHHGLQVEVRSHAPARAV
jgi:predicted esterase